MSQPRHRPLRRLAGATLAAALITALAACAGERDHFYALSAQPEAPPPAQSAASPTVQPAAPSPAAGYSTHVTLALSLPALVDRDQMVLQAADDRVLILEHQRWAAPLADLVTQTLARDLEQRRPDVLVADRSFDGTDIRSVHVRIDIVRMTARRGGQAILEAHWRIVDAAAKTDQVGGEVFAAPLDADDYGAVARAFSADLGLLADRLATQLPR